MKLRKWQENCLKEITAALNAGRDRYLVYASVGGGKTRLALTAAKTLGFERVIVVTYTAHLVTQWEVEASKAGLSLVAARGNSIAGEPLPSDADGYVTTFKAMGSFPEAHEYKTAEKQTLVIMDEIHHLSEEKEWGDAAEVAFKNAVFVLALSGTPMRTDGAKIPFVPYLEADEDGISRIDETLSYSYDYGTAVSDRVCSRVEFVPWDGPITWERDGREYTHTFGDDIPAGMHADRKRGCLAFNDSWENLFIDGMLKAANKRLDAMRGAAPATGGVITCRDQWHAKQIGDRITKICKVPAVVVVSDDAAASAKIEAFKLGETPWIVCVEMVSEGVDIPRLRLAVYLSRNETDLFYWQFMGRIVRSGKPAAFYCPKYPSLVDWISRVELEVEVAHIAKEKRDGGGGGNGDESDFKAIRAEGEELDHIVGGETYDREEIDLAGRVAAVAPQCANMQVTDVIEIIRAVDLQKVADPAEPEPDPSPESYSQTRERLRAKLHRRVGRLCNVSEKPHDFWNRKVNEWANCFSRESASVPTLERMLNWVEDKIARYE